MHFKKSGKIVRVCISTHEVQFNIYFISIICEAAVII